ncbi:hypothetical protein JHN54_05195, partial [Streptomyces sp. MBT70]|nr:hypothetical protein [Streptomyces sp. MBT70]
RVRALGHCPGPSNVTAVSNAARLVARRGARRRRQPMSAPCCRASAYSSPAWRRPRCCPAASPRPSAAGRGLARALRDAGPLTVVVALGSDGAVAVSAEGTSRTAAHPVPETDPVGAGDSFVAGCLATRPERPGHHWLPCPGRPCRRLVGGHRRRLGRTARTHRTRPRRGAAGDCHPVTPVKEGRRSRK